MTKMLLIKSKVNSKSKSWAEPDGVWRAYIVFFIIWIHSIQGYTAIMRYGVTRKRKKRLKCTGNLFIKNLQIKSVY